MEHPDRWWRVIAVRPDYEYGAVACYEQEAAADTARNTLMANRSDDVRRYGIEFVLRQDGDRVMVPLNQSRVLQWTEQLVPINQRQARRF